jgi:hypothetical protein
VVTAWSDGARGLLGYEPVEVVGRAATGLLVEALPAAAQNRCDARQPWSGRIAVRHRDGHRVDLAVEAHPLLNAVDETHWILTATASQEPGSPETGGDGEPATATLSVRSVQRWRRTWERGGERFFGVERACVQAQAERGALRGAGAGTRDDFSHQVPARRAVERNP